MTYRLQKYIKGPVFKPIKFLILIKNNFSYTFSNTTTLYNYHFSHSQISTSFKMRFNVAYSLACLAGSSTLAAAVPVEATDIKVDNLHRRGQIPANMDTTACKQYSTFIGEWTYEARIRTMDNTEDVCNKIKNEAGITVGCSWRHSEECRGDINDPRVAEWKFKAGTSCSLGAVTGIIRRATGQKGDDAQCLISFDGKYPGYE
ncbi:hypothetical protein CEP52_009844 [Fusarium oligoseptatum]|uniref:Uncharacterized protein n=1 Tax=Fusarium oligoseptatum TaxID=2604345 RepID=A0A428TB20_9HYPO|nr:hypothetical protein CEP52_009844 [Fusarium oligoseptatum]